MTETTNNTIEPNPGEDINQAASRMIAQRWHTGAAVTCNWLKAEAQKAGVAPGEAFSLPVSADVLAYLRAQEAATAAHE